LTRRNLRSRGFHEIDRIGCDRRASVSVSPFLGIIMAERTGLIAKKGPPRLSRPSAWSRQVARYRGLRDAETEHETLVVLRGAPQRKFSRAIRAIRPRISTETLGRPPRQRPRDRYLHIVDHTLRRQRKTVSGWTITRLSRQSDHQRDSKIQNRRSKRRKQGRRVRLRCSTAIWWRSAIDSNSSEIRVRGSLRVTETALLVGFAMKADYRHAFESTVEFVRIKF
jgi:hypothetical protein